MRIRDLLIPLNLAVLKHSTVKRLISSEKLLARNADFFRFLKYVRPDYIRQAIQYLPDSRAEIFQDIFCALIMGPTAPGFFVEFGATDGVTGSNTWLLEKKFRWRGILAEPARSWHKQLRQNRSATISERCVWKTSNDLLEFRESPNSGYSTLSAFYTDGRNKHKGAASQRYLVDTISLNDLLSSTSAPHNIDVLSMDTEGSEYAILSTLNFKKWSFSIIVIEHNYSSSREKIFSLLSEHGYTRAPTGLSKFDDWYVSSECKQILIQKFYDTLDYSDELPVDHDMG